MSIPEDKEVSPRVLGPGGFYGDVLDKHLGSGLILAEVKHDGARKVPKHLHELAFFNLLLNGEYIEHCSGETLKREPLSTVFHPAGVIHRGEIGAAGMRIFSVEMQPEWLERVREYGTVPGSSKDFPASELTWLATRLYREYVERDRCSAIAIEGLVLEMLAQIVRVRGIPEKRPPIWLNQLIERLNSEFREELSVTSLASDLGIHPVHLSRTFRQFYRQTVGDYLCHLRIQFAIKELVRAQLDLASVAAAAGFADQSHFTRLFKEQTGMTPGMFRLAMSTRKHGGSRIQKSGSCSDDENQKRSQANRV